MSKPLYFDYQTTTPVDPAVLEIILPYFSQDFGNPANRNSAHGRVASKAVEKARLQVAAAVGAKPNEIIFTSGATESNNHALKGVCDASSVGDKHIITSAIEHSSVLETCRYLESRGVKITYVKPDATGLINPDDVFQAITPQTILVSIMYANNEIGTIQPIATLGAELKKRGVLLHTDLTQGVSHSAVNLPELQVDLASWSSHKLYGPKGCGALYIRSGITQDTLKPLLHGGSHERGWRSGTLNVPAIVGWVASEIASQKKNEEQRLRGLRNQLRDSLKELFPNLRFNGHPEYYLANNLSVTFPSVAAEDILLQAPQISCSMGSACLSQKGKSSHVLKAIGLDDESIHGTVRLGLGRFTTKEEVGELLRVLKDVRCLR